MRSCRAAERYLGMVFWPRIGDFDAAAHIVTNGYYERISLLRTSTGSLFQLYRHHVFEDGVRTRDLGRSYCLKC